MTDEQITEFCERTYDVDKYIQHLKKLKKKDLKSSKEYFLNLGLENNKDREVIIDYFIKIRDSEAPFYFDLFESDISTYNGNPERTLIISVKHTFLEEKIDIEPFKSYEEYEDFLIHIMVSKYCKEFFQECIPIYGNNYQKLIYKRDFTGEMHKFDMQYFRLPQNNRR